MELVTLLRSNPILGRASAEALARLATSAELRIFNKGQRVMGARTPQSHVLVVALGAIVIRQRAATGGRSVLMGVLAAPAIFGDAEACCGVPWIVSGHASANRTTLVAIPNAAWERFLTENPTIAVHMYRDACARLMLVMRMVRVFALQDFDQRLLTLLVSAARRESGSDGPLTVKISLVELATALAVDRKTIFRHVTALIANGLITRSGRTFTLLIDPAGVPMDVASPHGLGAGWRLG